MSMSTEFFVTVAGSPLVSPAAVVVGLPASADRGHQRIGVGTRSSAAWRPRAESVRTFSGHSPHPRRARTVDRRRGLIRGRANAAGYVFSAFGFLARGAGPFGGGFSCDAGFEDDE
jgi:hypothetical protein